MKQMRLSMVITRFISLLITFFMIASFDGIAQTTYSVGSTDDWNNAISSLQENDIIQLTANVTMDQDNMPADACTINGGGYTLTGVTDQSINEKVFNLKAPVTFINTKLSGYRFFANGYTLKFEGDANEFTANLFGGHATDEVASTNIIIEGGSFGWINGGGYNGNVTGECYLKISGTPTITGNIFGGSNQAGTTVGSTHVEISGGSLGNINGGGYNGDVIGECYLKISGTPTITGFVFGGSNQKTATVGSTRVEISGGTFKNGDLGGSIFAGGWGCTVTGNTSIVATGGTMGYLYGGCSQGSVTGSTYVEVDGATLDGGMQDDNITPNGASIYGGGYGDEDSDGGYDATNGKVGSTRVVVKNVTAGTAGVILYGGGLFAGVGGNTDVTIEGGTFNQVWGSSYISSSPGTQHQGAVGGDVNVLVKGGTIGTLGAARDQTSGEAIPVTGTMSLTIEGGTITRQISSGNHPAGNGYKDCTLTIRNLGTSDSPYALPSTYVISDLVLDNSTVTYLEPVDMQTSIYLNAMVVDKDHPMTISGNGSLVGDRIILDNFRTGTLPVDVPLVIGDKQLEGASLVAYEKSGDGTIAGLSTLPLYKVGDTYRKTEKESGNPDEVKVKTVTITAPSHGKLSVVWKETADRTLTLDSGDKVPANTELTLSFTPDAGYQGGTIQANGSPITGTTYEVTDDVEFTVGEVTAIPYAVTVGQLANGRISATPATDVTIGTKVDLTITPDAGYRLKSGSLKVYKTEDESTAVPVSNNSFDMPAYNVTATAEFEAIPEPPTPPAPVYYTVTLPAIEGAATDPAAGSYEVESWDNFRFYLVLDKAYDKSEPVVTTSRNETLEPRASDGAYIVKYVRSDVEIFIDGIVKNPDPVANAEIQSGIKVWTNNHQLFIRTGKPEEVSVYTFGGQLQKKFRSEVGDRFISLPSGAYIVLIGDERFKVIL